MVILVYWHTWLIQHGVVASHTSHCDHPAWRLQSMNATSQLFNNYHLWVLCHLIMDDNNLVIHCPNNRHNSGYNIFQISYTMSILILSYLINVNLFSDTVNSLGNIEKWDIMGQGDRGLNGCALQPKEGQVVTWNTAGDTALNGNNLCLSQDCK